MGDFDIISITASPLTGWATFHRNGRLAGSVYNDTRIQGPNYPMFAADKSRLDDSYFVADIIFYTRTLSAAERERVEWALASKFSVANNLVSGHSYAQNARPQLAAIPPPAVNAPNLIPGLAVWLDLDSVSQATPLCTVKTKGYLGLNMSTPSGSSCPGWTSYVGNPQLTFGAGTRFVLPLDYSQQQEFTLVVFFQRTVFHRILSSSSTDPADQWYFFWDDVKVGRFKSPGGGSKIGWTRSGSDPNDYNQYGTMYHIAVLTFSRGNIRIWDNGALVTIDDSGRHTGWKLGLGFNAGYRPSGSGYGSGQLGTLMIFDRVLTTDERERIEAWIGWKHKSELNMPYHIYSTYGFALTPMIPSRIPSSGLNVHTWLNSDDLFDYDWQGPGTCVKQWRSQGSSGLTTSSVRGCPTISNNRLNNRPVLSFNTSQDMRIGANLQATQYQSYTIVYLARLTNPSTAQRVLSASNGKWVLGWNGGKRDYFYAPKNQLAASFRRQLAESGPSVQQPSLSDYLWTAEGMLEVADGVSDDGYSDVGSGARRLQASYIPSSSTSVDTVSHNVRPLCLLRVPLIDLSPTAHVHWAYYFPCLLRCRRGQCTALCGRAGTATWRRCACSETGSCSLIASLS